MQRLAASITFGILSFFLMSLIGQKEEKEQQKSTVKQQITIQKRLLVNPKTRPFLRKKTDDFLLKQLSGIIIHGTENQHPTADAFFHERYFNLGKRSASSHYCTDEKNILQFVPDREVAFHVGALNYTKYGRLLKVNKFNANSSTIGIEMCVNKNADFKKTKLNTFRLISHLWDKYGAELPLYRHSDITGKKCPKIPIDNQLVLLDGKDWEDFKIQAKQYHQEKSPQTVN